MTPEHHLVRNFAVCELPRHDGEPLAPDEVARALGLTLPRVVAILEELERNLVFLVRNEAGSVSWAFPVTTDRTSHPLRFSTGETVYAA